MARRPLLGRRAQCRRVCEAAWTMRIPTPYCHKSGRTLAAARTACASVASRRDGPRGRSRRRRWAPIELPRRERHAMGTGCAVRWLGTRPSAGLQSVACCTGLGGRAVVTGNGAIRWQLAQRRAAGGHRIGAGEEPACFSAALCRDGAERRVRERRFRSDLVGRQCGPAGDAGNCQPHRAGPGRRHPIPVCRHGRRPVLRNRWGRRR